MVLLPLTHLKYMNHIREKKVDKSRGKTHGLYLRILSMNELPSFSAVGIKFGLKFASCPMVAA